jgi:hypothetical protein
MDTSWEKFTNDIILEIAGEIEKNRRGPEPPADKDPFLKKSDRLTSRDGENPRTEFERAD